MPPRHLLLLIALVAVAILLSSYLNNTRRIGENVGTSPLAADILTDKRGPRTLYGRGGLTVVVFNDYQCPACRQAAPELAAAVAQDGNVELVYREWPIFGHRSERAAQVALAADLQGIYEKVHRRLMSSPTLSESAMRAAVEDSSGSWQQLQSDLVASQPAIREQLASNRQSAWGLGLEGTPAYLVGPILVEGALSKHDFLEVFQNARSEAERTTLD